MYPKNYEHAVQIILAAAQRFIDARLTDGKVGGPLTVGGDINPDKVTCEEIAASITLVRSRTVDPDYTGPRPLFGRACYGSNLPRVG